MKILNRSFFIGLVTGIILGILIVIVGGYLFVLSFTSRTEERMESMLQPPPFPTQTTMDYDWRVQGLDGRELDLVETKGKVIFLNFWATWCPPCVAEMPGIQRLYNEIKGQEIVFLCVAEDSREKVIEFVKEKGFTFPIYTLVGEKPRVFRTRGIPTTFITSRDGQIVFKHVGSAQWDHRRSVAFITRLVQSNPEVY